MSAETTLRSGVALAKTMLVPFERPDRLPRAIAAMAPWGRSLAGLVAGAAARYPDRDAIVDELGAISYQTLWRASQALATGLREQGVDTGDTVGILMRNHRGFASALTAASALGAHVVLLNTGFAAAQLADVVEHEGVSTLIHDDEFTDAVAGCDATLLDEAACAAISRSGKVRPPASVGRVVILTSGTTGRPKGATRDSESGGIEGIGAVLDRIPLRVGDVQVVAAPLFHAWGLSHLLLGLSRCATTVLSRRFDAEQALRLVADCRADVFVVVPVMLSRIMALPPETLATCPTANLRAIASSGSAIPRGLVVDVLDHFGPVLYNLYGSTEVAIASIAGPDDLRRDPSTAGRVALGATVEILDPDGNPVPTGDVGRVFVGNSMPFDGYTNGGDKERIRGLLSSGDMGYFRGDLLFIEGRDDDMIVSGGENVFPAEVEELLRDHDAVDDVAVVGVPDDEFGQVLAAYVVKPPGKKLGKQAVRQHVRDQLARHKVPKHVTFVDELPRNATGKLVRRALADLD